MGWSTITGVGGVERLRSCSKAPLYIEIRWPPPNHSSYPLKNVQYKALMDWSGKWTSANRLVLIDSVDEVDRDKIDHAVWKPLSNNNSRLEMKILSIARRRRCSKKTRK